MNSFSRRHIMILCIAFLADSLVFGFAQADDARPNIIWIVVEDQSRHYGCYGEPLVDTPTIDRLASEGVRFTNAAVTGPICSICRSALITGMYQTSIGAHHHRSGRGEQKIVLPDHVKLIPHYFQQAGYYTSLGYLGHVSDPEKARRKPGLGKSDYNFEWDESVYDGAEWSSRAPGQPFFAQIMLGGGKARKQARSSDAIPHVDAADVVLPPYYPRHPEILEDWASYLDTFTLVDRQVRQIVDRLQREGIADETIIFFLTDHGVSHARGKQFCYDEGIMVPLIVWGPGFLDGQQTRDELVAHIDVAASSLALAGIPIPKHLEARPLFGANRRPRQFVVSARDRADETYDRIRSVRTSDFKYIRNGYPRRPHLQPNVYKDEKPTYQALRQWSAEKKLSSLQEQLLLSDERMSEELYDLKQDPWELNNVASDRAYAKTLAAMRACLDQWIEETGDQGQEVESIARYDSDMRVYLDRIRAKLGDERANKIETNIRQMKTWWAEGK